MPIKIILCVLLFYLVYCGLIFLMQRRIMFPRYLIETPPRNENLPLLEKIWIKTSFGNTEAWFLPPEAKNTSAPAPAVIFAHGNGELIDLWPDELKKFNQFGIGVFLVEYPGYGRSGGIPSQKTIRETFNNAYDVLIERKDVDPAKIILFGRSLGGGAVCLLAAERPSAGMILMSTFTGTRSFARKYFVPNFLVRDPFDNFFVIRHYSEPILVVHGKFDEVIPYSHGTALYASAPHATMITYACGHNDCPPDWETFWRDIEAFLGTSGIIKTNE
jgi:pimeloyl-ACP methyl ester carboxylesterase